MAEEQSVDEKSCAEKRRSTTVVTAGDRAFAWGSLLLVAGAVLAFFRADMAAVARSKGKK